MALYEITQDCRIANVEYQKGDVVSDTEVGGFYPTVMKATKTQPKLKGKTTVEEKVEINDTVDDEDKEDVEEKVEKKTTKKKRK